jgi:hypothetical protein
MLRTLTDHQVEFIVVGGVSAVLQGAPVTTFDLDIVHRRSPENLSRLVTALQGIDAHYREHKTQKLRPTESRLDSPGHHLLLTKYGSIDVLGTIGVDLSYQDLLAHTVEMRTIDMTLRLLSLDKLIELKEQAGRDKDKAVLPILRRTLEEKRKS